MMLTGLYRAWTADSEALNQTSDGLPWGFGGVVDLQDACKALIIRCDGGPLLAVRRTKQSGGAR
jgi:hypothetical protein